MKLPSLLSLAMLAFATPAFAYAGWSDYVNARFGYQTAVPPGFSCAPESDNGDGRICRSGAATLTVFGGYTNVIDDKGFAGAAAFALDADKQAGWTIAYQASTPGWASYSGTKGERVLYVRMIGGCKDAQYATLRLEYRATQINAMKPVVEHLGGALRQKFCAD